MREPEELLQDLLEVMTRLGEGSLSAAEQRKAADRVTGVFNHMSELVRQPSGANVLLRVSAQQSRQRELVEQEQGRLDLHRAEVEKLYKGGEEYLRAIQLGAFAVLFAVWGFTRTTLHPTVAVASALCLTLSVATFGLWEIAKGTITAVNIGAHARLAEGSLQDFLRKRTWFAQRAHRLPALLPKLRATSWVVTIVPALIALMLLVGSFVTHLLGQF